MQSNDARDSTVFPAGYGDFTLESSDGVICHFPRYLLGYMSQFFQNMFTLPVTERQLAQGDEASAPLKVTESGQILELLLAHMDPKTRVPGIDPSTVVPLLEAAEKYQVSAVVEWFKKEALLKHKSKDPSQIYTSESFVTTHPILALYCAVHFRLPNTGQFALQEFANCNVSCTFPDGPWVDMKSYFEGLKLREARRKQFDAFTSLLTSPRNGKPWANTGHKRQVCITCTGSLALWISELERVVRNEPNWRSFVTAYEKCPNACYSCNTNSWADYFRTCQNGSRKRRQLRPRFLRGRFEAKGFP